MPIFPYPLYHFTNVESAKKILASGEFHLTHRKNLNDQSQVQTRFDLISRKIQTSDAAEGSDYWIDILNGITFSDFYIGCFCLLPNEKMWQKYADKGKGVCIAVDGSKLQSFPEDVLRQYISCPLDYGLELYKSYLDELLADLIMPNVDFRTLGIPFAQASEYTFKQSLHAHPNYINMRNKLSEAVIKAYINKDTKYSFEREFRILHSEKLDCSAIETRRIGNRLKGIINIGAAINGAFDYESWKQSQKLLVDS